METTDEKEKTKKKRRPTISKDVDVTGEPTAQQLWSKEIHEYGWLVLQSPNDERRKTRTQRGRRLLSKWKIP